MIISRHQQAFSRSDGAVDSDLTEEGKKAAADSYIWLKSRLDPHDLYPSLVVVSGMGRSKQTAAHIGASDQIESCQTEDEQSISFLGKDSVRLFVLKVGVNMCLHSTDKFVDSE